MFGGEGEAAFPPMRSNHHENLRVPPNASLPQEIRPHEDEVIIKESLWLMTPFFKPLLPSGVVHWGVCILRFP